MNPAASLQHRVGPSKKVVYPHGWRAGYERALWPFPFSLERVGDRELHARRESAAQLLLTMARLYIHVLSDKVDRWPNFEVGI
jgi:hypothetical protein